MAAISITAANVKKGANSRTEDGLAAVAVTAGQLVYLDPDTGKYGLADADSASAVVRKVRGIALHAAAADQPLQIHRKGLITIGATVTVGAGYYSSATAGGIAPVADNTTGVYPTFLGFAVTASVLDVNLVEAGVAVP